MVQWLILCIPNAGGMGSIPGQRTKIPYAEATAKKKKKKVKIIVGSLYSQWLTENASTN